MWSNAFLSQARWNWTTFGTAEKVWDRVRQYFVSESERIWTAFQRIGKHQIGRRGRPKFFLGNPSAPGEFRTATDRARKRFLLEALRVLTIFGRAKKIGSSSESVRLYFCEEALSEKRFSDGSRSRPKAFFVRSPTHFDHFRVRRNIFGSS